MPQIHGLNVAALEAAAYLLKGWGSRMLGPC